MKPTDGKGGTPRGIAVGMAGMMGSGKSTVARAFEDLGAVKIDADQVGKALLEDDAIKARIVEAFGESVLGAGGEINTYRLGEAAFADGASATKLNDITRGPLVGEIMARVEDLRGSADVIVVDAALLPEWGGHAWLDFLIVVDSDEETCVRRLAERSRFDEDAARARMACQLSREDKKRYADLVISNDGSEQDLVEKAREAYETVLRLGERSHERD
jgi:dephospho-CoA kinase